MSSNEPVKNGCEVTYEMFHIIEGHSLLDFKSAVQYMKHFIYHFIILNCPISYPEFLTFFVSR